MRVEYDFLRVGSFVEPRRGHIYVDVGNQSLPGVIDTHADRTHPDEFECSSSLIVADPGLVTRWISGEDLESSIHVVMHENPDFDCIASSLLVRRLLEAHAEGKDLPEGWGDWAPLIANAARKIDRGETRVRLPIKTERASITPYLSLIGLHDYIARESLVPKDSWSRFVEQGQGILERAVRIAAEHGHQDLELVDLRGSLADLSELEAIIDQKVLAFERDARRIGIGSVSPRLPGKIEGVFSLELPRHASASATVQAAIACIRDPECGAGFFKSMIRGAYADTIQATCVFLTNLQDPVSGTNAWSRPIISVDPDSSLDLRGLGRRLDVVETEIRERQGMQREGRPRPGFNNSDPWYDGRTFAFTIVDAPRWGTLLTPDQVLSEVLDVRKWLSLRVSDVVEEMLSAVAFAPDPPHRSRAWQQIAAALDFWRTGETKGRSRLYAESVDAVAGQATCADARAELLSTAGNDVLLGLLTNRDPAVRVQALIAAGRERERVEAYARRCGRDDVPALLSIVIDDASDAAERLVIGTVRTEHALLFDAVAARLLRSGASDALSDAAISLAARNSEVRLLWRSVLNLWLVLRGIDPDRAKRLEPAARKIVALALSQLAVSPDAWHVTHDAWSAEVLNVREELALRVPVAKGIERTVMQSILGGASIDVLVEWRQKLGRGDGIEDFRTWLASGRPGYAAQMLLLLLSSDQVAAFAPEQRDVVLHLASDLFEQVRKEDHGSTPFLRELVARLSAAFGAGRLLDAFSQRALMGALHRSPECVGALVRIADFSREARWGLLQAATRGGWPIDEARRYVLTPEDAARWSNVQALTSASAAARTCIAASETVLPAGHARCATLFLAAASAARTGTGSRTVDVLTDVSRAQDLQTSVDAISAARLLIGDELRHVAPDHVLLADAEASLAKAETLARAIESLGPTEKTPDHPLHLLLRFALVLPELDLEALKELRGLHSGWRGRKDPLTDSLAKCAFKLAAAVQSVLDDGKLTSDAARVRKACASISAIARLNRGSSIEELVHMALHDAEGVLTSYALQLERAVQKTDGASQHAGKPRQDPHAVPGEVLQASTLAGIARDFPGVAEAGNGRLAVEALSDLARHRSGSTALYSRFRRKTPAVDDERGWRDTVQMLEASIAVPKAEVNTTYERLRDLLKLPVEALDGLYARIVQQDIADYDLAAARRKIDAYTVDRVSGLLSFWMSGWTIIIPAVFVLLFTLAETQVAGHAVERRGVQHAIEVLVLVLIGIVAVSIGLEWQRRRRARNAVVDKLRYELFLPHYGVPVLIGVYSAAMSHEMTSHLALQLDDGRFIALGAGLFMAAAWALWRVIRREKHHISQRSVLIATARLFSYGFVVAILLNLMLGPLLNYQAGLHHLFVEWITKSAQKHHFLLALKIQMPSTEILLFPRHIVLDALFGMFASIVLEKFLGAKKEH